MQLDPSNLRRDVYDLSTDPPLCLNWRDTDGPQAVLNGRGRYAFADEWDRMSKKERSDFRQSFEPKPPQRPHNLGQHVFNPADRMNHPTRAEGTQGLHKYVWDLQPEDGGESTKVLMDWTVACEAVERGQGRYCFAEPGDATPPRAQEEIQ